MARLKFKREHRDVPDITMEQDTAVLGLYFGRHDIAIHGPDGGFIAEYLEIDGSRADVPPGCSVYLPLGWEITPEEGSMVMLVAHEDWAETQSGIIIENMPLCFYAKPGHSPRILITNRTGSEWPLEEGEPLLRAMVIKPNPLTVTIEETKP